MRKEIKEGRVKPKTKPQGEFKDAFVIGKYDICRFVNFT